MNAQFIKHAIPLCCIFLFAIPTAHADDIQLVLGRDLGNKLLSSIDFPYEKTITPRGIAIEEGGTLGNADLKFSKSGKASGPLLKDASALLEENILDALIAGDQAGIGLESADPTVQKFLKDLSAKVSPDNKSNPRRADLRREVNNLLSTDKDLQHELDAAVKRLIDVHLEWIKLRINKRPDFQIDNPINLNHLDFGVKVRLKVCADFGWLGKPCTGDFSVGYIHFNGNAKLLLTAVPPKLYAAPQFHDLNIVTHICLFHHCWTIHVGVTNIVNRVLAKSNPLQLADLSSLEYRFPSAKKAVKIGTISIRGSARGLILNVKMKVVPAP